MLGSVTNSGDTVIICSWAIVMVNIQDSTGVMSESGGGRVHGDGERSLSDGGFELLLVLRFDTVVTGDGDGVRSLGGCFARGLDTVIWVVAVLHETKALSGAEGSVNVA